MTCPKLDLANNSHKREKEGRENETCCSVFLYCHTIEQGLFILYIRSMPTTWTPWTCMHACGHVCKQARFLFYRSKATLSLSLFLVLLSCLIDGSDNKASLASIVWSKRRLSHSLLLSSQWIRSLCLLLASTFDAVLFDWLVSASSW